MSFTDGAFYQGVVIRQELVESREKYPVLLLGVKLKGMLVDAKRPDAGTLPAPDVEVEARINFNPDNEQVMKFSTSDLTDLGFTGEDISVLAPDHPQHHSFIDKIVHVCPSIRSYNGRNNTYWNLRFPKARENKPVSSSKIKGSAGAEAYRAALKAAKNRPADDGDGF